LFKTFAIANVVCRAGVSHQLRRRQARRTLVLLPGTQWLDINQPSAHFDFGLVERDQLIVVINERDEAKTAVSEPFA
jgi:hypothetical protein